MSDKVTQKQFLEKLLRGTRCKVTVAEARDRYGIKNLRARICEMSKDGLTVQRTQVGRAMAYGISSRDAGGSRLSKYTKPSKQKK